MVLKALPQLINQLNPLTQEKFRRIYRLREEEGRLLIPPTMQEWVKEHLGPLEEVEQQKIIHIENRITGRAIIFNPLRARRPDQMQNNDAVLDELIQRTEGGPFCHAEEQTPQDVFGRVRGSYCLTAANVSKIDKWHSILIFKHHHPLRWSAEEITDCLATANRWFQLVHEEDSKAVYPFLLWNCLWRAGASIIHGHMQLLISQQPYSQKKILQQQISHYQRRYQSSYLEDIYEIHQALDLTLPTNDNSIKAFVNILPLKEKEITIFSPTFNPTLWNYFGQLMTSYRDKLGVQSFNVGITLPPLNNQGKWQLPVLIEITDRGRLESNHSDVGGMEKFAQEVIAADPFMVREALIN